MIRWLLQLIGIPASVAPERRRSLVERLKDPLSEESQAMRRAQAALDRHRRREDAIKQHQAERADEKAACQATRKEHQSEIAESTISLNRTRRRKTSEIKKRHAERRTLNPNPFLASELARKDAERRRREG